MTRKTSMKNIEIILAIRDLQKMISDTETQEIINILKQARNSLIKIYAEDKEELQQILTAIERMSNQQRYNMNKISAVYKITNTVTGDFYIGSSNDINRRWAAHKHQSVWKKCPNNQLYKDMQEYGTDKFDFQVLEEVEADKLKVTEQKFIELLNPTYNSNRANGFDFERQKKYNKEYNKSDKGKEAKKKYNSQLCCYNGETITLDALYKRFLRKGIPNPTQEAKKYLM